VVSEITVSSLLGERAEDIRDRTYAREVERREMITWPEGKIQEGRLAISARLIAQNGSMIQLKMH
jgi:hypothetical protein